MSEVAYTPLMKIKKGSIPETRKKPNIAVLFFDGTNSFTVPDGQVLVLKSGWISGCWFGAATGTEGVHLTATKLANSIYDTGNILSCLFSSQAQPNANSSFCEFHDALVDEAGVVTLTDTTNTSANGGIIGELIARNEYFG